VNADGKADPLILVVENVDLRNVADDFLFVDVGGVKAPVTGKWPVIGKAPDGTDLDRQYTWLVKFVPPAEKPKGSDSPFAPSLLYGAETLAQAPEVKIAY